MTLLDHPTGQRPPDTQDGRAGGVTSSPDDQTQIETHQLDVVRAHNPSVEANSGAQSSATSPRLADPLLTLRAEILDDLEKARIANSNRIGVITRPIGQVDEDGEERGWGLSPDSPEVQSLRTLVDGLAALEHAAVLDLQRAMRKHPLGPWVRATIGVGEKQAARLLSAIGDPYWNTLRNRPRTVSELWAYCGLHTLPASHDVCATQDVDAGGGNLPGGGADHRTFDTHVTDVRTAARRKKGQKANWSTVAKTRAYLIAGSCIKQARSPYRTVYDQRRLHTAATHPEWTPGHSHADGLRIVAKAILKDLWVASRDIHLKGVA